MEISLRSEDGSANRATAESGLSRFTNEFIKHVVPELPRRALVYLDPPYFLKGAKLYLDHYDAGDKGIGARRIVAPRGWRARTVSVERLLARRLI